MNAFNLSAWAVKHKAVVLYLMLAVAAAGLYAYFGMGRAEDPPFTIKTMVVTVNWPGATPALVTLAPGARTTLRASFLAGSPEPKLTVAFETGVGSPHGISTADYRAGFDTRDTNVGRVYDFGHFMSNAGDLVTLTPR